MEPVRDKKMQPGRHRERDKMKKASSSIGSLGSIRRQKEKETRLEGEEGETN